MEEALDTFKGYDAAIDEPFHLAFAEVMRAFPEAKFIFTDRDAETWFRSYNELETGIANSKALGNKLLRGLKRAKIPLGPLDPDSDNADVKEFQDMWSGCCLAGRFMKCWTGRNSRGHEHIVAVGRCFSPRSWVFYSHLTYTLTIWI